MDLNDMTGAKLVELHNRKCPPDQRLTGWKSSKSKLIEKIEALGEPTPSVAATKAAEESDAAPKTTIGASVRQLLLDPALSYKDIVEMVRAAHPDAATSERSVASVACVMRKGGTVVPLRRGAKGETA